MTRLEHPEIFAREKRARRVCEELAVLGPIIEPAHRGFRVVVNTAKPEAVLRWLGRQNPAVTWHQAE